MGLLKRVNHVITARLHGVVDSLEDPERMLKQTIRDMESAFQAATESTAKAIAGASQLKRQTAAQNAQVEFWKKRAGHSVQRGDDDAARKAIVRKIEHEKHAAAFAVQLGHAEETGVLLRDRLESMRNRLEQARFQLSSLVARQRSADARRRFIAVIGNFESDVAAFCRFDELSRRVADSEAEAEVLAELSGEHLDVNDTDADVDGELAALKQEYVVPGP